MRSKTNLAIQLRCQLQLRQRSLRSGGDPQILADNGIESFGFEPQASLDVGIQAAALDKINSFFECIAIHGRHAQGVRAEIGTLIIHAGRPEMESAVFLEADKAADNLPVLFYDDKTNQIAAKTAKNSQL
ncbi:hypothetical protein YPPY89_1894 [Yersinia pestis PY-89]|nr:hypothetical protein YPPY89_1894 [Yersinia pestis PY-89]